MHAHTHPRWTCAPLALACLLALPTWAAPVSKLDAHLQALMQAQAQRDAPASARLLRPAARDGEGRIGVSVALRTLDDADAVAARVAALGGRVQARWLRAGATGALSVQLPLAALPELAASDAVRALRFAPRPVTNIGAATSQGVATLDADRVQAAGVTGKGITVAVISDSYNASSSIKLKAPKDIATGDLPGKGNPNGKTTPVVVLDDTFTGGIDEGRAMLQIVHDIAPDARLCFGSVSVGEEQYAALVAKLIDKAGPCGADVVVDDITFLQASMFSDNLVSQAVNDAAAQGVHYFSSAGNRDATMGYMGRYSHVANDVARAATGSPVNLALIPVADTAGGFHNFAPAGAPTDIAYQVTVSGRQLMSLQWNDLFDANRISTDYDVYIFSGDGQTLVYKGATDNTVSDRPMEFAQFGSDDEIKAVAFQIVIARRHGGPTLPEAQWLRWVQFGYNTQVEYPDYTTPIAYGNNAAAQGNSVAATPWWAPQAGESWSSPGPGLLFFDAQGNRLAKPTLLKKPDFSAPDDGNTTFFGFESDEDTDQQPNFTGTSASAPHAAAVAALVLEKAGGPKWLTPAELTRVLQQSAAPHELRPFTSTAVARSGRTKVTVTALGNGEQPTDHDANSIAIALQAPAGTTLESVTFKLATANAQRVRLGKPAPGLWFNPGGPAMLTPRGAPPSIGALTGIAPSAIGFSKLPKAPAPLAQTFTVRFAKGSFTPASKVHLGVGREAVAGTGATADMHAGGTIEAVVRTTSGQAQTLTGTFTSRLGLGWTRHEGAGLINAQRAVDAVGP